MGISISDEEGKFAFPKCVLPNNKQLAGNVRDICSDNKIKAVVLGESNNFQNEPNEIMKKILPFKTELERILNIPIFLEPEFMTSAEASRIAGEDDMLDARAAALILQSFLDKEVSKN